MYRLQGTTASQLAAILTVMCVAPHATAAPLLVHEGLMDPANEGWVHENDGCTGCTVGPGSETTATGVHDYWRVEDASMNGVNHYLQRPCRVVYAGDWTFEAKVRVIDSPVLTGTGVGTTVVIVADGRDYWSFYLDNAAAGPVGPGQPLALNPAFAVDTRDDYRVYRIEFAQNAAGPLDDSADFFVDGQPIAVGVGRSDVYTTSDDFLWFGAAGTAGTMEAHFEYVRFDGRISADFDGDGVPNDSDNCAQHANASQRDSNGDGIGNRCDPDLNDDDIVNATDLGLFKQVFFTGDADADFNGDGQVNSIDLGIMKSFFFQRPGPSCTLP